MSSRIVAPKVTSPLSLDAIVATATELARAEGLSKVSMRRVADGLGVSPMALYRHVEDREDLLLRMLDVVADGIGSPPAEGPPRARLAAITVAVHQAFRCDPWVVQVLVAEGLASPGILPVIDAAFAEAGLPASRASLAGFAAVCAAGTPPVSRTSPSC